MSQQVKRLEEAFGASLFERDRRGLRLTHAGERLFGKGKRLLGLNDEIWWRWWHPGGRQGYGSACLRSLRHPAGAVLKVYGEAYPQVEISLVCTSSPDLASALAAGTIDLAVDRGTGRSDVRRMPCIDRWSGSAQGRRCRAKRRCRCRSSPTPAPSARRCCRRSVSMG